MQTAKAIVVVEDAAIASALEIALLAAGLTAVSRTPGAGMDSLPLGDATILIVDLAGIGLEPLALIERLRSRDWPGLAILITDDRRALRGAFADTPRVAVLEMPFVAADLIAAIRSLG